MPFLRIPALLLLLPFLLPLAAAQKCTKPGYGTDPVCTNGNDPYCDGQQCLYQQCVKGFYASQVHEEGVIYDSETANLCTHCPGEGQTTDVGSGGLTYGIGECYIPCGPAKCYVPSSGGLSLTASQTGTTQCMNKRKGICESTCTADASLPIPDAYTIGTICHKTRLKKRSLPLQPRVSARHVKKNAKAVAAPGHEKKVAAPAPAPVPEPSVEEGKAKRTSGSKEREKAKKAKLASQHVKRGPKSYEHEEGPYAKVEQYRY